MTGKVVPEGKYADDGGGLQVLGLDGKTLFMTATTQLYRIQTNVRDASHVLRQQAARDI